MIIKFEDFKLNESPDHIYDGDNYLTVDNMDALGFYVNPNKDHTDFTKIYFTDWGGYHSDMKRNKANRSYPGRLWQKSKIITFWTYPNEILFKKMIEAIEKKIGEKIFNNGWKIEVVKNDEGNIIKREFTGEDDDYFYSGIHNQNTEFIPIEEYAGSEDFDDIQKKMHLMGWEEKQRMKEQGIKLAPGFGSDRTAWDKPRNLKYRQTIYQENKKENE